MNCHACSAPMLFDEWGHPCHDGPCPGYPPRWRSPIVECNNCHDTIAAKALSQHHRTCTPDNPRPPRDRHPVQRCPICMIRHAPGTPTCPPLVPRWPVEPLMEAAWARGAERTLNGAADAIGTEPNYLRRAIARGGLDDFQADRWSIRLGSMPHWIWPDWIEAGLRVTDASFVAEGWRRSWLHNEPTPTQATEEAAA